MSRDRQTIRTCPFGSEDPLGALRASTSVRYIRRYLADLGCRVVLEEPVYFDRDYLAEFAAFYCKSARGYPNSCRRLHFFSDAAIDRAALERATCEDSEAIETLQRSYLGFAVVRPFEPPLLGRTVLRWYPEDEARPGRRVIEPSRDYFVHLAGIRLRVHGLAWQPQDTAVGACATVALWSMLHSSALDDHHAIPTTAEITMAAHKTASLGHRMFPSRGLTTYQLYEAIKAQKLSPIVMEGDLSLPKSAGRRGFSKPRFLSSCAAFIRAGYPVLLVGKQGDGRHAVCVSGFREIPRTTTPKKHRIELDDTHVEFVYVHDDNLGPGVRCRVDEETSGDGQPGEVILRPEAPPNSPASQYPDPSVSHPPFQPMSMVIAAHRELVMSPDALYRVGEGIAARFVQLFRRLQDQLGLQPFSTSLQTRFVELRRYMVDELRDLLSDTPASVLGRVRLELAELARPMSLHLGVVQLSFNGELGLQILFDTTDNERFPHAFVHLAFDPKVSLMVPGLANELQEKYGHDLGVGIDAFVGPGEES